MNQHWGVRLGDVARFVRGITYKPADVLQRTDPDALPCMRTKNVQVTLEDDDLVFIPRRLAKPDRLLREGDILVSSANSWNLVGKCSWVPNLGYEATFGGFISVLRADPKLLYPRYLYHWFAWDKTQTTVRSLGQQTTNISNLNQNRCLDLRFELPPLNEQRRIAAILDKADALRQERKRAIVLLDSLTQSIFLEMFGDPEENPTGWPIVPIGDLLARSLNFGSMNPPRSSMGEWLSLRVANIQDWALDLSDMKFIDLAPKELDRFTLADGDIVLARAIASQEHLGKCVVVEPGARKWAFDSHLMRIRLERRKLEPIYLRELFRTPSGRALFLRSTRKTTVQYNINTRELSTLRIPVPPIVVQREFVNRVLRLNVIRRQIEHTASRASSLFASLQHRAFSVQL